MITLNSCGNKLQNIVNLKMTYQKNLLKVGLKRSKKNVLFAAMKVLKNDENFFFIHAKSTFRSQDI